MKARFTPYPELLPEMRRETRKGRELIAARIMADAIASAPRDTGQFASRFYLETGDRPKVVNSDPGAQYIEYGTSRTPAHGTLTNAARKYGKYTGWTPRDGAGSELGGGSTRRFRYVSAAGVVSMRTRAEINNYNRRRR